MIDENRPLGAKRPNGARLLRMVAIFLGAAGLVAMGVGVWMFLKKADLTNTAESSQMATTLDIGRSLRDDISRVVRPAMVRTSKSAEDPEIIAALRVRDLDRLSRACNSAIVMATEIDALAVFDASGRILAINTVYASGQPIAPDRVKRIMGTNFDQRDIIQKCVRNNSSAAVLEFQTHCDITPAFFDSTGLSIAYSVPINDPSTGRKIGVISSRLRFNRLLDLIGERHLGGKENAIEFVTDHGGYFSEAINSGQKPPPIPERILSELVAPLVTASTEYSVQKYQGNIACLFRLRDFSTLDNGGIQVLLMRDEQTLLNEARLSNRLHAAGVFSLGLLLLVGAGLMRTASLLQIQEFRMRRLLETALDGVIVVDESGVVRIWNNEAEKIFGYSTAEVLNRPLTALETSPPNGDPLGISQYLPGKKPSISGEHLEITALRRDGTRFQAELAVVPVPTDKGIWYSAFVRDTTEHHHLEAQLAQSQKLESIGQLAAGIAHEINTPVQYVGDNTRFIEENFNDLFRLLEGYDRLISEPSTNGRPPRDHKDEVAALRGAVDIEYLRVEIPKALHQSIDGLGRITKIVAAMKDFSHPGSDVKELGDLNAAIQSTTTICRYHWRYVADMELDLDPTLPHVPVLLNEFNQVVLNLVVNAADAIAELVNSGAKTKGKIRVSSRVEGDQVVIEVGDDGAGIPLAARGRIFDPFFTTKQVGKGTGQGLSICHNTVVKKHQGQLTFTTAIGKGTVFTIKLPRNPSIAGETGVRSAA